MNRARDETALLEQIERLPSDARYKEWTANRRVVSYGGRYDFGAHEVLPASPIPPFLCPLRAAAAGFVGVPATDLTHALDLAPRSIYSLAGEARWGWQHSISPTEALRYSITFRTLRAGGR